MKIIYKCAKPQKNKTLENNRQTNNKKKLVENGSTVPGMPKVNTPFRVCTKLVAD